MVVNRNKYGFGPLALALSILVFAGLLAGFFFILNKDVKVEPTETQHIEHHETDIIVK